MRKKQILGLDLSDGLLTAVVLTIHSREQQIQGCCSLPCGGLDEVPTVLEQLLEEVNWDNGEVALGLSLAECSIRNLSLPFREKKKIAQTLPLELEDQLMQPVAEYLVDHQVAVTTDWGSELLCFCISRARLQEMFKVFKTNGLEPFVATPAMYCLGRRFCPENGAADILLMYADFHSVALALFHKGNMIFLRRIANPEEMVVQSPFLLQGTDVRITDQEEARRCVSHICRSVLLAKDIFCVDNGIKLKLDRVILTGPMSMARGFYEMVRREFNLEVVIGNLRMVENLPLDEAIHDQWLSACHDRALAVALESVAGRARINFCQDEFALGRQRYRRRQQIALAVAGLVLLLTGMLGYLAYDYHRLKKQGAQLTGQMHRIFRETFPKATRVVDPLAQMQARLKALQAPQALPVYAGEKRVLGILADISRRIPASVSLHVTRLVIDPESVQIKGTTNAFNNVEIIKSRLAASDRYEEVKILSASADKDKGMIRFEIKLQLGGAQ